MKVNGSREKIREKDVGEVTMRSLQRKREGERRIVLKQTVEVDRVKKKKFGSYFMSCRRDKQVAESLFHLNQSDRVAKRKVRDRTEGYNEKLATEKYNEEGKKRGRPSEREDNDTERKNG